MLPLVSVITPAYNQADFLPDALDSLLAQTFSNWECIVVSDGSTDELAEVVDQYVQKNKRILFFDSKHGGPSVARNFGIRQAKGEFILPLDADDKISPNYIEECLKAINISSKIKLVYGAGEKFGLLNEPWKLKSYSWEEILFGNMIHTCAMYRKADWEQAGGYDESMIDGIEDWEFWISLLNKDAEVVMLDHITFFWRIKKSSRTKILNAGPNVARIKRHVYSKHADLYNDFFIDPLKLYTDYKASSEIAEYANEHSFRFFCSRQWKKIKKLSS